MAPSSRARSHAGGTVIAAGLGLASPGLLGGPRSARRPLSPLPALFSSRPGGCAGARLLRQPRRRARLVRRRGGAWPLALADDRCGRRGADDAAQRGPRVGPARLAAREHAARRDAAGGSDDAHPRDGAGRRATEPAWRAGGDGHGRAGQRQRGDVQPGARGGGGGEQHGRLRAAVRRGGGGGAVAHPTLPRTRRRLPSPPPSSRLISDLRWR